MSVIVFEFDSSVGQRVDVRGRDRAPVVAHVGITLIICQSNKTKQVSFISTLSAMVAHREELGENGPWECPWELKNVHTNAV